MAEPSGGVYLRVYVLRAVNNGTIERVEVFGAYAFHYGVGYDRSRVVAHHAAPVPGAGPFGQERVLLGNVYEAELDFLVNGRVDEVEEREEGAESVPEAGVGVHVALAYFAVVRAVVQDFAVLVYLVELAREKGAPV